jgi:ferredoxin--NADP+ reductase
MKLARNELYMENGRLQSRATGVVEELPVDLVFRSVGYRGVPIDGLPFDQRSGVIPNEAGRVVDPSTGRPVPGLYVSGWIKRGPSGVIGTNKKDGTETATSMLEDAVAASAATLGLTDPSVVDALVRGRQPECVTYADWARLDAIEIAMGEPHGRPRVKLITRDAVREALTKG